MGGAPSPGPWASEGSILPTWVAAIINAAPMGFSMYMLVVAARRRETRLAFLAVGFISLTVAAFFGMTVPNFDARIIHYLTSRIGLHATQIVVGGFVILMGWCAHRFKQANKLWYGYLEVMFAVISAVVVVSRIDFGAADFRSLTLSQYCAFVGAAYVAARGLNNISEARQDGRVAGTSLHDRL